MAEEGEEALFGPVQLAEAAKRRETQRRRNKSPTAEFYQAAH